MIRQKENINKLLLSSGGSLDNADQVKYMT
jgi:hypothetical protein